MQSEGLFEFYVFYWTLFLLILLSSFENVLSKNWWASRGFESESWKKTNWSQVLGINWSRWDQLRCAVRVHYPESYRNLSKEKEGPIFLYYFFSPPFTNPTVIQKRPKANSLKHSSLFRCFMFLYFSPKERRKIRFETYTQIEISTPTHTSNKCGSRR